MLGLLGQLSRLLVCGQAEANRQCHNSHVDTQAEEATARAVGREVIQLFARGSEAAAPSALSEDRRAPPGTSSLQKRGKVADALCLQENLCLLIFSS